MAKKGRLPTGRFGLKPIASVNGAVCVVSGLTAFRIDAKRTSRSRRVTCFVRCTPQVIGGEPPNGPRAI